MFGGHSFLSSDTLSAKAVSYGIEASMETYDEYPLWMPWMFGGLPSTHSMQNISEYYFPHQILSILKLIGVPWFWNFILHFLFCGLGMYLLLRKIKLGFYSSSLGAISFMITPWMVVNIVHGHGSQVMTAAYIPWILWSMLKLEENSNMKNMSLLALLIGLQLQRGHVQIAYYTWMIMGAYILYHYISSSKINIKFSLSWIISSIIGLCMSLWIYIPVLNYTPHSKRAISDGGASFDYATAWSLHPYEALTMILPSSYGFGDISYFGYMPFTSFPNYIGILLTIFVVFAIYSTVININSSYHKNILYFFLCLSIFSLLISFGKYFSFYKILFNWLPFFNKFRVPSMILVIFQFSIIVLASIGLDSLLKRVKENHRSAINIVLISSGFILSISILRYLFHDFSNSQIQHQIINDHRLLLLKNDIIHIITLLFLFISSFIACMNKKITITVFSYICIFLSISDIYLVNQKIINPSGPASHEIIKDKKYLDAEFKPDDIINFLRSDKGKYRVMPLGSLGKNNRLVAFNIESIEGYHPAKLSSNEEFRESVLNPESILKTMNVKYVLSLNKFPEEQASGLSLKRVKSGKYYNNFQYDDVYVYQYLNFKPRVQFLHKINSINSKEEGYDILNNNKFDIQMNSFISRYDYLKYADSFSYNSESTISIKEWSPNRIVIDTKVVGPENKKHFVLLSEIYFPYGWEVENHNIEIIETNNLFRGFFVSSGENEIVLSFNPKDLKYGAITTYSSFIMILFMLLLYWYRNERV